MNGLFQGVDALLTLTAMMNHLVVVTRWATVPGANVAPVIVDILEVRSPYGKGSSRVYVKGKREVRVKMGER